MAQTNTGGPDTIDVRRAAALLGCHPETVRRWVWSGRLSARREGRRLVMARADVEALAASEGRALTSLGTWADRARVARAATSAASSASSAAELVIDDRAERSRPAKARAGR